MPVVIDFPNKIHADRHKAGGADPIRLDQLELPGASVNFNGQKAVLLADPTTAQDAATKNYVDSIPGLNSVVIMAAGGAASPNTFHVLQLPSAGGVMTFTLPAAPPQGTVCEFFRSDSNYAFGSTSAQIVPSGTDTINGTNPYVLGGATLGVRFTYVGSVWQMHGESTGSLSGYFGARSAYNAGFNPSLMARDSNGRSQVNDPSASTDVTNKNYVDNTAGTSLATSSALMRRDAAGRVAHADPSASSDSATKNYVDTLAPNRYINGGTKTGAFSAVAGNAYLINFAASLGSLVVQLPTTPAQGTAIAFLRLDSNFITSFPIITPGGSDTMDGGANFNLAVGGVVLVYLGTSWRVLGYGTGGFSGLTGVSSNATFPPSIMSRDAAGRSQVVDPSAAQDIATKNYVDVTAGTALATASALMRRDAAGRVAVVAPSAATDAANKAYVDGLVGTALTNPTPRVANLAYTTTEVIGHQWPIPANVLAVGSSGRMVIAGSMTSGTTPTILGRLRCGTAGTIADAQVIASAASAALAAAAGWRVEVAWTVRVIGASGVLYAEMELVGDNIADRISVATANFTINTTVANFLSLCALAGGTTPAGNILMGYSWVIKP